MAGVRIRDRAGCRVDGAVEEADEPALGDVAAQDPVHLTTDVGRTGGLGRERADGRLQVRHQQRRRDALADDVGDGDARARERVERDRVEAVAADARGRLPRRRDLAAVDLRHARGQQLALNPAAPRPVRAVPARSASRRARPFSISVRTVLTSCSLSHGFCTKSCTPRRIDSTARSTEPQPVMTMIGRRLSRSWMRASRSMPSRPDVVSLV